MSDNQQWAFPQGFPFPYIRFAYFHGTNTTGLLNISFTGYVSSSGHPIPQTIPLFSDQPMGADDFSKAIYAQNFTTGMMIASWAGQDQLDGSIWMEGSIDGQNWNYMGANADDVGSVTINAPKIRQIKIIPPIEVSSKQPITVVTEGLNNPQVLNRSTSATPNLETSILLAGVTRFQIANRGSVLVRLAYQVGTSSTIYKTLYPNAPQDADGLSGADITLYVSSPGVSQRLEIERWS